MGRGDFGDEIDIHDVIDVTPVIPVTKVNPVIAVNMVIITLSHKFLPQLPAERLVRQRLLQRRQRCELLLVEAGEVGEELPIHKIPQVVAS